MSKPHETQQVVQHGSQLLIRDVRQVRTCTRTGYLAGYCTVAGSRERVYGTGDGCWVSHTTLTDGATVTVRQ